MGIKINPLICLFLLFVCISCSQHRSIRHDQLAAPAPAADEYYPGIDSTVIKSANEIADRLFVDYTRRNQASIWYQQAKGSFQIADSIWRSHKQQTVSDSMLWRLYLGWQQERHVDPIATKPNLAKMARPEELSWHIWQQAEREANKAKLLNPFDLDIRSLIVYIYSRMGETSKNPTFYQNAIEELKNLLLVDKSNPYLYEQLAECYYALQDWENCYQCFEKAEQTLLIVTSLKSHENAFASVAMDTSRWVYYLQGKGEAKAKLYDSNLAIRFLTGAMQMTRSESQAQQLQNYLKWINWDAGNLKASELRDEAQRIEQTGDYRKSQSKYQELLSILTTQRAKNEIDWKIASIDFNHVNKKLEAIQRLYRVIHQIQQSGAQHELNAIYFQDYAAMCYSVGVNYYNQHNYRFAYIYINQAAQFEWDHRGDCYFQLAILSEANPQENIQNCQKALTYAHQLSNESQKKIQKMLTLSYIRLGEFEVAHDYYQKFRAYESTTKN